MGQSKRASMIEALANVAIGYGISVAANIAVMPAFGYHITVGQAAGMGLIFTVISIVRSYMLRRAFNWLHLRGE
ncbi:hypothetical protein I2H38_19565 [Microvirga sp. BT350]|uniref:Uncharacterized protein n=1 Tax=Microvirga alba TaxID=2791025 RepID=A0A931FQ29_9HYPH|nr:hypothetical protein [Microvirga alba]